MKKLFVVFLALGLTSLSASAQEAPKEAPKKECCKTKKSCDKDKKECKKDKKECSKEKKECNKSKKTKKSCCKKAA